MRPVIFFLSILFFCNLILNAQAIIEWENFIGGDDKDELYSIYQTADDGFILGAQSWSGISDDKSEASKGLSDYWIIKLDPNGNVQWDKTFGGDSSENVSSMSETSDGGYIIGGHSWSGISGDKTGEKIGLGDCWILKLNAAGEINWQKTIGGSGIDLLYHISETPDGGYILGSWSDSNISGDKTENNLGSTDYWVIKLDADGNIAWQNTIGGNSEDQLNTIKPTSDGGYIIGGNSKSGNSGDKTEANIGENDYWIIKLDAAGNIEWQNTIGGSNHDRLKYIEIVSEGGYILGGYSRSGISDDKSEEDFGDDDYWVVKLNEDGNIEWDNTIGGTQTDELNMIKEIEGGFYILGGSSASGISGDKSEPNFGALDYWIVKLDHEGNVLWDKTLGSVKNDELFSIDQIEKGKYILGGYSQIDPTVASRNCWVVKLADEYNQVTGNMYMDLNENAVQEASEPVLQYHPISKEGTDEIYFSKSNGFYLVNFADAGIYTITPASTDYYAPVPENITFNFPEVGEISEENNFGYVADGSYNDLCVSLASSLFVPGFESTYTIYYENVGTTTLDATIIFLPGELLSYVDASMAPVFSAPDSIVWNVGLLAPYESGTITVTVLLDASAMAGDIVISQAIIQPIADDANESCNYANWESEIVSSFDPNNILVDKVDVPSNAVGSSLTLDYIINFQNTGTYYAQFIRVHDTLPVDLKAETLEILQSSHAITSVDYYSDLRLLKFSFDDIYLPDSNTNEPGSHGFVRYRIKPLNTLIAGDEINNTAHIYFDYNPPVITNTATTKIIAPVAIDEVKTQKTFITVSPNPFSKTANITLNHALQNAVLFIYDIYGRQVKEIVFTGNNITLQKETLTTGTYFYHVEANGIKYGAGKIIVQ